MPSEAAFVTVSTALPSLRWGAASVCQFFSNTPLVSKRRRRCLPQHKTLTTPKAVIVKPDDEPTETVLESFSAASRGEWKGYEGKFNSETGEAVIIPDYYIPEQFLEWGLSPKGFESNHSIIVRNGKLYRKFFRILPTVSLFADHVDLEEELKIIPLLSSQHTDGSDTDSATTTTTIYTDGSFVSGARKVLTKRESRLDKWPSITFCLRDDVGGDTDNGSGKRRSANMWVQFDFEQRKLVGEVRAVIEEWSCDYCDGADLEGSSGFVDGWPSHPCGSAQNISGEWTVVKCGGIDSSMSEEDGDDSSTKTTAAAATATQADKVVRDGSVEEGVVFLPDGLDVSISECAQTDGVVVQAGWLVNENTRVVLRRQFGADGTVEHTEHVVEVRDQ